MPSACSVYHADNIIKIFRSKYLTDDRGIFFRDIRPVRESYAAREPAGNVECSKILVFL